MSARPLKGTAVLRRARKYAALIDRHRAEFPGVGQDFRDWLVQRCNLKISGGQLGRYLRVLTPPPEVQTALTKDQLTMADVLQIAAMPQKDQQKIAARIRAGETPKCVLARYGGLNEKASASQVETPADRYRMLLDFVDETLDDMQAHTGEIVGKAMRHIQAVALLGRLRRFAATMEKTETRAHTRMISQMRDSLHTELHSD